MNNIATISKTEGGVLTFLYEIKYLCCPCVILLETFLVRVTYLAKYVMYAFLKKLIELRIEMRNKSKRC